MKNFLTSGKKEVEIGTTISWIISDYNQIISYFDKKATMSPACNAADLNDDGTIDGSDYNLMLRSFNQLVPGGN